MKVNINGVEELLKDLGGKTNIDGKLKRVVLENTATMQSKSQRGAPVDTGYMKSKITQRITDGGMTGIVGSEAPYSEHVEFGTFKQSAKPFMRPAFRDAEIRFKRDIKEVMKK